MRNKYKTKAYSSPLNIFTALFCRPLLRGLVAAADIANVPAWDCFLVSNVLELTDELVWASCRPESRHRTVTSDVMLDPTDTSFFGAFWACLTNVELQFLDQHMQTLPYLIYSLNQNPDVTSTHSTWTLLHTLIKNAGVLWLPRFQKVWLSMHVPMFSMVVDLVFLLTTWVWSAL
jgi:hypothetical protein